MNLQNQINWMKTQTKYDLLDGISVPNPFNLDRVKSAIVLRCGLLTPIYSEPEVMREAITNWSEAMQWNFVHLANMVLAEYNPIHNYDRTEFRSGNFTENNNNSGKEIHSGTDNRNIKETHSGNDNRSITETHSGNDNRSITEQTTRTGSDTDTTTNTVAAENVSSYQADTQTVHLTEYNSGEGKTTADNLTHGENVTTSDNLTHGAQIDTMDNMTHGKNIETQGSENRSGKDSYELRAFGNIGVTTNFQMLQGEKDLISSFNPYKWIAEQFENDLCIMLY